MPHLESAVIALIFTSALHAQVANSPSVGAKALRPPRRQALLLKLQGKGSQIYACQNSADGAPPAWKLKAPDAKLFSEGGEVVGRHFAGPTWEYSDGSQVIGQMVASQPAPERDSIPWLLIKAVSHSDKGAFSRVQNIQRLATKGGVAPDTGCTASHLKEEMSVPYEATYYFYGERVRGAMNNH